MSAKRLNKQPEVPEVAEANWFFSLTPADTKKSAQDLLDLEPAFLRALGAPVWDDPGLALADLRPEFKGTIYDYQVTVSLVGKRVIK